MFDVMEIVAYTFGEIGVSPQAVHLGPPRQAGLNKMACIVVCDFMLEICDQFRPLGSRANQAHFSFEDVPELRDFVDVPLAHESANLQTSRIIFRRPSNDAIFLGIEAHTANLDHFKRFAFTPEASLAVEDRAWRFKKNERAKNQDDWQ